MTKENWVDATMDCFKLIIDNLWDKAYKQGYEAGKADTPFTETAEAENKAYQRGCNDAWKVAAHIAGMSSAELSNLFGEVYPEAVIKRLTVDETRSKLNKE